MRMKRSPSQIEYHIRHSKRNKFVLLLGLEIQKEWEYFSWDICEFKGEPADEQKQSDEE